MRLISLVDVDVVVFLFFVVVDDGYDFSLVYLTCI